LGTFLDAAKANLGTGAREVPNAAVEPGVLFLTESAGVRRLRDILDAPLPRAAGRWTIAAGADGRSALARDGEGSSILLVEGRQIATRERLEVLGLGCGAEIPDGLSLEESLARVLASGALAVIPWGFGKWWASRGRRVAEAIAGADRLRVFLGDNGGRLRHGPPPALFPRAEALGFRVLPGSDPLPFPREVRRVGSYGFALDASVDAAAPVASLLARLASPGPGFDRFGRRASVIEFARNQIAMQWRLRAARV
jgi:hypothetical protein